MDGWFNRWFNQQWQSIGLAHVVLMPLSWLFGAVSAARRWLYQHQYLRSYRLSVPVIVVGNISVGGTGKTPLVIYLAKQLAAVMVAKMLVKSQQIVMQASLAMSRY